MNKTTVLPVSEETALAIQNLAVKLHNEFGLHYAFTICGHGHIIAASNYVNGIITPAIKSSRPVGDSTPTAKKSGTPCTRKRSDMGIQYLPPVLTYDYAIGYTLSWAGNVAHIEAQSPDEYHGLDGIAITESDRFLNNWGYSGAYNFYWVKIKYNEWHFLDGCSLKT
jgi:hypothetical protein